MLRLSSLIFRNVRRNRRRSLLTIASIAVSLALLSLLLAMFQTFFYGEDVSPSEALRLVTRHRVSLTQPLPASHMNAIRSVAGVKELTPFSWFQGVYIDNRQEHFFARFACDADRIFDIHLDWEMPADQIVAFKQQRTACAIGEQIAKDQNLKIGDRLTIKGDIYNATLELTVVGIFKHPQAAQLHLDVWGQVCLRALDSPTVLNRLGKHISLIPESEHAGTEGAVYVSP